MAVCLRCHQSMQQTEAACSRCGEEWIEPQPSEWDLFFKQSSLANLFRFVAVTSVVCAFLPWIVPMLASAVAPFVIGITCGLSVLMLGDASAFWSRMLSLLGIVAFLFYPLLGIVMYAGWLIAKFLP